MSVPAGARRALGALVASLVALACTALWLMALTAPMNGMASMTGMVDDAGVSVMAGMGEATVAVATAPAVAADVAADAGPAMASMCDTACVAGVTDVCALAAGLIVTVISLLVGSRRDTFVCLLARIGRSAPVRPRWSRDAWTVLSLSSLGLLRI